MKIVLLDLDNTLIDADYNINATVEELRSLAEELSKRDVQIGLCSDSALITLKQWAGCFGFTGPIISERGAVILYPDNPIEEVDPFLADGWFRELRELFIKRIMRDFPGATIFIGDATSFVKNQVVNAAMTKQIFAVNGFRIASFSFFTRRLKLDHRLLVPDPELLVQANRIVHEILESCGKSPRNFFWDENLPQSILIAHAISTEKRRGISTLIDRLKPDQTIMIGDSMSDFLGLSCVSQFAVNNADPNYKAKSVFVSKSPLTKGVIECLKQI